ncbi:MAG: hypothetical protein AAGA03_09035 [Planctomycetota bacterium]
MTHSNLGDAHGIQILMNVNFFEWIRDGVRQSVLMGVSDAIEQIGTPEDTGEMNPNVAAFLQGSEPAKKPAGGRKTTNRKRLGKSLKDMDAAGAKAA